MIHKSPIPTASYGVLVQDNTKSKMDEVAEQVRRLGYAVLDSGLPKAEVSQISESFNRMREAYGLFI